MGSKYDLKGWEEVVGLVDEDGAEDEGHDDSHGGLDQPRNEQLPWKTGRRWLSSEKIGERHDGTFSCTVFS